MAQNGSDVPTARANPLTNATGLGTSNILIEDKIILVDFGNSYLDPRVPDLTINATVGTVWTPTSQVMNHGGFLAQDLNVRLLAYNPKLRYTDVTDE